MTHALSSTYVTLNIIGSVPKLMKASLALYSAARIKLDNSMWLLGLTPADRYVLHPFFR
jgi:arginyl-tRNA synthetase